MDNNLKRIFEKWDEFKQTHAQDYDPERRLEILDLYEQLQAELADDAVFTLDDHETTLSITIAADSFLSSTNFPALQELIHSAAAFRAEIQEDKIVFDMLFVFWDWIPQE
ncbi:MAG: hypothetical protein J6I64_07915 [Lachnospiraceae bacterium]|nr:hypothetical protein [Lachnospiraceae bacterium]